MIGAGLVFAFRYQQANMVQLGHQKMVKDPVGPSVWIRKAQRIETDTTKPEMVKRDPAGLVNIRNQLGLLDGYGDSYFSNLYREF